MEKLRGSWIWLLVLYSFASLVETFFYGHLTAFTPLYLPKIGISPEEVSRWTGIIAAVTGLVGLPFLPFWGALADRFSRKPIIIRSFIVEVMAGLLAILAGNIWIFLLARAVSSLSLGNSGLMMTTLSERAPFNRQALSFSIMNAAGPIGVFLGPLVGGPVVDHYGFPTLLGIDVLLLVVVILSLALGYRDTFKPRVTGPLLPMAGQSISIITSTPRLRALFVALFLLFSGWALALTYASLAVAQIYKGPDLATQVGIILGAAGFVAMVISPVLGALADRFGGWRVLFIASAVAVVLWPLPALAHTLALFAVLWGLINGLSSSLFSISFNVLSQSTTPETRGRVMSMSFLPMNVGLTLGPTIGSLITRQSVMTIFPAGAVLTLLGILLLSVAYRSRAAAPVGTLERE